MKGKMMISIEDKNVLIESINRLNDYLDSKEYAELKMNSETPIVVRRTLVALIKERGELTQKLLKIYASEISENDTKFKELLESMNKIAKNAEAAQDKLQDIAGRIKSVNQMAKFVDSALKLAAGLM
jgi:methyl-accepting chemotaxis protein